MEVDMSVLGCWIVSKKRNANIQLLRLLIIKITEPGLVFLKLMESSDVIVTWISFKELLNNILRRINIHGAKLGYLRLMGSLNSIAGISCVIVVADS